MASDFNTRTRTIARFLRATAGELFCSCPCKCGTKAFSKLAIDHVYGKNDARYHAYRYQPDGSPIVKHDAESDLRRAMDTQPIEVVADQFRLMCHNCNQSRETMRQRGLGDQCEDCPR